MSAQRAACSGCLAFIVGFTFAGGAVAQVSQSGCWEFAQPEVWPFGSVHAIHLPNGTILVWDIIPGGSGATVQLWDPSEGAFDPADVTTQDEIGCAGFAGLGHGPALVIGGFESAATNEFLGDAWGLSSSMNHVRVYPTCTTLPNGKTLVLGGSLCLLCDPPVLRHEVYDGATWQELPASADRDLGQYPHAFLLPGGGVAGKVAYVGAYEEFFIFPASSVTAVLDLDTNTWEEVAVSPVSGFLGSAVMYEPGRILQAGGNEDGPIASAATIDFNDEAPSWTLQDDMIRPRERFTLVMLPDGHVLAVGGRDVGSAWVHEAEWYDPEARQWELLAAMTWGRSRHSTAVLLPDGRVLAAGWNETYDDPKIPDNPRAEIFCPPYLFNGPRPVIGSAPGALSDDTDFSVVLPNDTPVPPEGIEKVTLLRLAAVTHGFDQNQRYMTLQHVAGPGPLTLTVTAPADAHTAPPGYYMLFLVSTGGVPSIARYVQVRKPGDLDGDGVVGVLDFLALLAAWSPCGDCVPDCPADLDGDCQVGITDLLGLLANWG